MSRWEQRTIEPDDLLARTGARPDLDRVQVDGRVVVTKTARGRRRTSLRREAEILDRLRLRGIVEMIEVVDGDDTTTLVMEDAGRRTLADPIGLSSEERVRALRRSCAAVHELHVAGWAHGALQPDHIVLGLRGRTRLCSFTAARPIDRADRTPVDADIDQLVALVSHVASLGPPDSSIRGRREWHRRSRRLRRIADDARTALRSQVSPVSADDLAVALATVDAPRHLPTASPAVGSGRSAAVAVTTLAVATAAAITWVVVGGPTTAATSPTPSSAGPAVTTRSDVVGAPRPCAGWPSVGADVDGDGCPEAVGVAGNLVTIEGTGYRLGADGDIAAVGDWDCDGVSTARLLRPTTGELFEFPTWASTGAPIEAYPVTTLFSATGLRRAAAGGRGDGHGTASCDRMLVTLQDGTEIEPIPLTPRDTP